MNPLRVEELVDGEIDDQGGLSGKDHRLDRVDGKPRAGGAGVRIDRVGEQVFPLTLAQGFLAEHPYRTEGPKGLKQVALHRRVRSHGPLLLFAKPWKEQRQDDELDGDTPEDNSGEGRAVEHHGDRCEQHGRKA